MSVITSLVGYWAQNEASGNALDSHGSNTLTETNGPIAATTGKVSGARDFEAGSTQYFSHANNSDFQVGDIDFSWAGWIQFESTGTTIDWINKWDFNILSNEYLLRYDPSGPALRFFVSSNGQDSGNAFIDTAFTPVVGTWYFVACGHSASANELWISYNAGTPVVGSGYTAGVWVGTSAFYMGALNGVTFYHDGLLDEWGFWKRDIRSDLSWLCNSVNGRSYADIVAEATPPATRRFLLVRR